MRSLLDTGQLIRPSTPIRLKLAKKILSINAAAMISLRICVTIKILIS
jgi:hypothetical protein